jgi:AraC-like DNA-binding protein
VLQRRRIVGTPDLVVDDVRCRSHPSGWSGPEVARGYGVVFVRRGCFRRRVHGAESVLERPGDEQEVAHPIEGGDACTAIALSEGLVASLYGGDPGLPTGTATTPPAVDLAARRLIASRDRDPFEESERAIVLLASVVEDHAPERVRSCRPATDRARRRVVDDAREVLASHPSVGLVELARRVAVSPHHLSRIFHELAGETVSPYRNRLRVRLALERIADGERNLASLAIDLGFADGAHLARRVRRETGRSPSELRLELGA